MSDLKETDQKAKENPPEKQAPSEPAEPQETPKSEEGEQKEEGSEQAEEIVKKTAYIEANRLASLKKEIEEIESRIETKMKAFKKFVDDTEVQGRSLAGPAVEQTEEQKKVAEANKLLAGTGLKI